MSKVEEYRAFLRGLEDWDAFLLQESRLPGPRANLELAFAVASEGDDKLFLRYASLDPDEAPGNSAMGFLAVCGVLGLGYLAADGETQHLTIIKTKASDSRWRIREAVAMGLQQYGRKDMAGLVDEMETWLKGNLYERRAVVAALCEPELLADRAWTLKVFDILDLITLSIVEETDRKSDGYQSLRKGLAYGWSVAAVAHPEAGLPRMEKWIGVDDKDVHWIMKQNLRKKRMSRMDAEWVEKQLERLK